LLEAWASPKSFRPKDGSGEPPGPGRNGEQDFHGERRTNDTHTSTEPRHPPRSPMNLDKLSHVLGLTEELNH
jgi:hypothetical protein